MTGVSKAFAFFLLPTLSVTGTGGYMRQWTNRLFGLAGHYDDQSKRFWVLTGLTQPHKLALAT
jgi:hypothetical protein